MPSSKNQKPIAERSHTVTTTWLKNATKSIGSAMGSTIKDISPNIANVATSGSQIIRNLRSEKATTNRIANFIRNNQYVRLGQEALTNAIKDLKSGNFSNEDRQMQSMSGEETSGSSTYFGDFDSDDGGATPRQLNVQLNPEGLNRIGDSIDRQTKHQLTAAKAQVDAIVATSSASMAMSQKNATAIITSLGNIQNTLQGLLTYQNENMTKFIEASMGYYEKAGKSLEPVQGGGSFKDSLATGAAGRRGEFNLTGYGKLLKESFAKNITGTVPGQILNVIKTQGKTLAANPLGFLLPVLMDMAIPGGAKASLKELDKTFGNFMTEGIIRLSGSLRNNTKGGGIGQLMNFLGKVMDINVDRRGTFKLGGKVNKDAAVFDKITKNAISVEIPKYLRESTAYLRELVLLNGGDPDGAVRGSHIFNKRSGEYQRWDQYQQEMMKEISSAVVNTMSSSTFGAIMNRAGQGLSEKQLAKFNDALEKFYLALEREEKSDLKLEDLSAGSDMDRILNAIETDDFTKKYLRKAVGASFQSGRGGIGMNAARLHAKNERNRVVSSMEEDYGADLSTLIKNGDTIDDALTSILYGKDNKATKIHNVHPNSVIGKLQNIEDILLRGINVKVVSQFEDRKGSSSGSSNGSGIIITGNQGGSNSSGGGSDDIENTVPDLKESDMDKNLEEALGSMPNGAKGPVSKFIQNKSERLSDMMHYVLKGNMAMAYSSMAAMFGDVMSDTAGAIKRVAIDPLKEAVLGDKGEDGFRKGGILSGMLNKGIDIKNGLLHLFDGREYTKSDGTKVGKEEKDDQSITGVAKGLLGSIKNGFRAVIFGDKKKEDGTSLKDKFKSVISEGLAGWRTAIFGEEKDPKKLKEDFLKEVEERTPDAIKGGLIGGLTGIVAGGVLGAFVGPLTGTLIGTAVGFAAKSKKFQNFLFGEKDEQGNVIKGKEGIFSQETQKLIKENKNYLIGMSAGGALLGTVKGAGLLGNLVGGPIGGALIGTAIGFATKSKTFQEMIFGKDDGKGGKTGGLKQMFAKAFENPAKKKTAEAAGNKAFGMSALGAGAGLLAGFFTPLGPVGGALVGLGGSIAAEGKNFHKFLFGDEDDEGEHKGLLNRFGALITTNLLNPIKQKAQEFQEKIGDKFEEVIVAPIKFAFEPLAHIGRRLHDAIMDKLNAGVSALTNAIKKVSLGLLRKTGEWLSGKMNGLFGLIGKAIGGVIKAPFNLFKNSMNAIGTVGRKINERASRKKVDRENYLETSERGRSLRASWQEQWENMTPAQQKKFGSYEKYEHKMKGTVFYGSSDTRATDEAARLDRAEKRKQTQAKIKEDNFRAQMISNLTGGRYSTDSMEARKAALEKFKASRAYEKGKGYGGASHEDVLRLLNPEELLKEQGGAKDAQTSESEKATIQSEVWLGKVFNLVGDIKNLIGGTASNIAHGAGEKISNARQNARLNRLAQDQMIAENAQEADDVFYRSKGLREEDITARANEAAKAAAANGQDPDKAAKRAMERGQEQRNKLNDTSRTSGFDKRLQNATDLIHGKHWWTKIVKGIDPGGKRNAALKGFQELVANPDVTDEEKVNAYNAFMDKYSLGRRISNGVSSAVGFYHASRRAAREDSDEKKAQRKLIHTPTSEGGTGGKGFAEGGKTNGELAAVGENGPEIVQLPAGGNVIPNSDKNPMAVRIVGASDDMMLNVNVAGQNDPLATYKTGELTSETDRRTEIERDIKKDQTLAKQDDINDDTDDEGEGKKPKEKEEKKESLLSKLMGFLTNGSGGGILGNLGTIAAAAGGLYVLFNTGVGKKALDALGSLAKAAGSAAGDEISTASSIIGGSQFDYGADVGTNLQNTVNRAITLDATNSEGYIDSLGSTMGHVGKAAVIKTGSAFARNAGKMNAFANRGLSFMAQHGMQMSGEAVAYLDDAAAAGLKGAKTAVSSASRKKNLISSFFEMVGKVFAKLWEAFEKKFGAKGVGKAISVCKSQIDDGIRLITTKVGTVGSKVAGWITEKISAGLAKLGISTAATAGTAGLWQIVDVGIATISGLNASGKGGTARLFGCKQEDVDGLMRVIATLITGLKSHSFFVLVDVFCTILKEISGIDLIRMIATTIYNAIAGEEKAELLSNSKAKLQDDYDAYYQATMESGYADYLAQNGMSESDMSFEDYQAGVQNGDIESDIMGFDTYNESVNKTFGAKIWGGIKNAGSKTVDFFKTNGKKLTTAASGILGVGGITGGISKLMGAVKDGTAKKAISGIASAGANMLKNSALGQGITNLMSGNTLDNIKTLGTSLIQNNPIARGISTLTSSEGFNRLKDMGANMINNNPLTKGVKDLVSGEAWQNVKNAGSAIMNSRPVQTGIKALGVAKKFAVGYGGEFIDSVKEEAGKISTIVKAAGSEAFKSLKDSAKVATTAMSVTAKRAWGALENSAKVQWDNIKKKASEVSDTVKGAFDWAKDGLKNIGTAITNSEGWQALTSTVGKLKDAVGGLTDKVKSFLGGVADAAKEKVEEAKEWLGDKKDQVTNWASGKVQDAKNWVSDKKNKVSNWFSNVGNGWNNFWDIMNTGVDIADKYATARWGGGGRGNGNVPFYSQKDQRWANLSYDSTTDRGKMSDTGCGPAAFAMAAESMGRNVGGPVGAASMMQSLGARDATGTNWGGIGAAASEAGIPSVMAKNPSAGFVDAALSAGNPVILSGRKGGYGAKTPYTPGGHYVVATGKDSQGNYIINDPNQRSPKRYNKYDVMSETGAAWGFGGRGPSSKFTQASLLDNSTSKPKANKDAISSVRKWVKIVRAVKKLIAAQQPGYYQDNGKKYINVTLAGKTLSVRPDCNGFVCACLKYFGEMSDNDNIGTFDLVKSDNQKLLKAGFTPHAFVNINELAEGDICCTNGHVEVYAHPGNGANQWYVYNCGSTKSVNNPEATVAGTKNKYVTIWRVNEGAGQNALTDFDENDELLCQGGTLTGDSSYDVATGDAVSTGTENNPSLMDKILGFFGEFGKRAANGLMAGKWDNDWTSFKQQYGIGSAATASAASPTTSTSSYTGTNMTVAPAKVNSSETSKAMWKYFRERGINAIGTAAAMGNINAESGFMSNNLQNTYNSKFGMSDDQYTAAVDNGSYTNFSKDSAGYGLAQWTSSGRKLNLYNYMKGKKLSIADPKGQIEFLYDELKNSYPKVYNGIKNASNLFDASTLFMQKFEAPANKDVLEFQKKRASMGQAFYNMYANGGGGYGNRGGIRATSTNSTLPNLEMLRSYEDVSGGRGTVSTGVVKNFSNAKSSMVQAIPKSATLDDVIQVLRDMVGIMNDSSSKLDMLQKLDNIQSNNILNINNQTPSTPTGKPSGSGGVTTPLPKVTPSKYNAARKIASGGL